MGKGSGVMLFPEGSNMQQQATGYSDESIADVAIEPEPIMEEVFEDALTIE